MGGLTIEILDVVLDVGKVVLGAIIGAWIVKRMMFSRQNTEKMAEPVYNYVEKRFLAWIQTPQASKLLYQVGGVAAAGFRSGVGLTPGKGKFKLDDIIAQLVGRFAESAIDKILPSVKETEQAQSSSSGMNLE